MASTPQSSAGGNDSHIEGPPAVHSFEAGEAWDAMEGEAVARTAEDAAPHVSLFSPNVRGIPSSAAARGSSASPRPYATTFSPPASARSSPSLASLASVTKRFSRHGMSKEHLPMVQNQPRIDQAQKSADDPTNTADNNRKRRTTTDLMMTEQATRADLNTLFSESAILGSRAPSYNNATGPLHVRASIGAIPLPDHLFTRGLLEGRHSDITVIAFGQHYHLHRLILDRAPFFTTALSEPWLESRATEVVLHPEEIDNNITQAAFDLAIKKLYGVDISKESDAEAVGLFATGCWLEMQDLIDGAIDSILRQMIPDTIAFLIRLVTANYYGRSGDRILESAKAMLSRNGWEMPLKYWDDMPGDIIRELIGSDGFFIDSEWDRWVLTKRLLDRRLRHAAIEAGLIQRGQKPIQQAPDYLRLMAVRFDGVYRQNALTAAHFSSESQSDWLALYTNSDIGRILVLLDEGIHYMHMDYEQLQFIRTARDVFGLPVMPDKVVSDALWQQLDLRHRVLNSDESAQELGLYEVTPEPESANPANNASKATMSKGKARDTASATENDTESESWDGNGKPRKFWIPSSDCNIVLGNGSEPVITTSSSFQRHASRLSATIQPEDAQWATDFASTPSTLTNPSTRIHGTQRPISAGGSNAGQPRPIAYTEFPPFRFSAEFPNPRFLKEKKRVYSRTVAYAGSLWNIYIQKVRSAKNVQLGVYLHRAKEREAEESAQGNGVSQQNNSSVDERIGQLEREVLMRSERLDRRHGVRDRFAADMTGEDDTSGSGGDVDAAVASSNPRNSLFSSSSLGRRRGANMPRLPRIAPQFSFVPLATPLIANPDEEGSSNLPLFPSVSSDRDSVISDDDDEADTAVYANPSSTSRTQRKNRAPAPTLPSYIDGRPTIKTYFKIYSPSKGGRMLSIYESAPDRFNFSQSWGWKSSTLMLDEISIPNGAEDVSTPSTTASKRVDGKLRFMVVIGNL